MIRVIKKIGIILHPYILFERIRWLFCSFKLKECGKKSFMSYSFSIIEPQNITLGKNVSFGHNSIVACYENHFGAKTGYKPELYIGNNIQYLQHSNHICWIYCGDLFGKYYVWGKI